MAVAFGDPDRLSQLALEAITYHPTAAEEEAARRPPYPVPPVPGAVRSFYEAAEEAIERRMAVGSPTPLYSTGMAEPAGRLDLSAKYERSGHNNPVSNMVCILLAAGLIPVSTTERAVETCGRPTTAALLQLAIVHRLLDDGDIDAAREAADSPVFDAHAGVGWRAIGNFHAVNGEAAEFIASWSKYGAAKYRWVIEEIRRRLVDSVSRRHGWCDAVAVVRNKRIGTRSNTSGLLFAALRPLAERGDVRAMDQLLATEDLPGLEEIDRLRLLVEAMLASAPGPLQVGPDTDHPDLVWVEPRILSYGLAGSKQQARERDWLLISLWRVIGDDVTLTRVRRAVRAPVYRRELTRLDKNFPIKASLAQPWPGWPS